MWRQRRRKKENCFGQRQGAIVNCVNSIKPFMSVYDTRAGSWHYLLLNALKMLDRLFCAVFVPPKIRLDGKEGKQQRLQQHECDIFMWIKASCGESRKERMPKMEASRVVSKIPSNTFAWLEKWARSRKGYSVCKHNMTMGTWIDVCKLSVSSDDSDTQAVPRFPGSKLIRNFKSF